jgi:hypothetical protein
MFRAISGFILAEASLVQQDCQVEPRDTDYRARHMGIHFFFFL